MGKLFNKSNSKSTRVLDSIHISTSNKLLNLNEDIYREMKRRALQEVDENVKQHSSAPSKVTAI